jgi:protein SCO1
MKKVPLDSGDYTMDHTALVYLMDKQGRFVAPFNLKRRPEDAAADLRRYL